MYERTEVQTVEFEIPGVNAILMGMERNSSYNTLTFLSQMQYEALTRRMIGGMFGRLARHSQIWPHPKVAELSISFFVPKKLKDQAYWLGRLREAAERSVIGAIYTTLTVEEGGATLTHADIKIDATREPYTKATLRAVGAG